MEKLNKTLRLSRKSGRIILLTIAILVLAKVIVALVPTHGNPMPPSNTSEGYSDSLPSTSIVPTLDSPMPSNTNVIWCSSFQYAWNELRNNVIEDDVLIEGAEKLSGKLNKAEQSLADMPRESCYANAGIVGDGIVGKIKADMAKNFPSEPSPAFGSIPSDSIVAYSFLNANIKFTIPYFENKENFIFTDSNGNKTDVTSFGIREKDEYAYYKLREQIKVCYGGWDSDGYALDLCKNSNPNQIIVAVIKPEKTLSLTVQKLERKILDYSKKKEVFRRFGPNDVFIVPNILFNITHHFKELEGKFIQNKGFKGYPISEAIQMIQFKLDRSGAELKSEAKMVCLPVPTYYAFDRPFLVYMKKRGAEHPFFVMWIDNAELLTTFE